MQSLENEVECLRLIRCQAEDLTFSLFFFFLTATKWNRRFHLCLNVLLALHGRVSCSEKGKSFHGGAEYRLVAIAPSGRMSPKDRAGKSVLQPGHLSK